MNEKIGPYVFLASPGDLLYLRESISKAFKEMQNRLSDDHSVKLWRWELEHSENGFDDWKCIQQQIPLPTSEAMRAALCFFGERIGTPMPAKYPLPPDSPIHKFLTDGGNNNYRLVHPWIEGAENNKGFPLTGTIFECLCLLGMPNDQVSDRPPTPFRIFFLAENFDLGQPKTIKWGRERHYEELHKKLNRDDYSKWYGEVYAPQIKMLANFAHFLQEECGVQHHIVADEETAIKESLFFLRTELDWQTPHANPFKGLELYDRSDAQVFFGRGVWRSEAVRHFTTLWQAPRIPLFGIVGPSGTGKSSMLRAGIIENLTAYASQGSYDAVVVTAGELVKNITDFQKKRACQTPLEILYQRVQEEFAEMKAAEEQAAPAPALLPLSMLSLSPRNAAYDIARCLPQTKLIIGLDQFETVLDYRADPVLSDYFDPLFLFIKEAVETGRIGFIYTLASGREDLLSCDPILGSLLERGGRSDLGFPGEGLPEIARRCFETVDERVAYQDIDTLCGTFSKIAKNVTAREQGSLLPLFSVVLARAQKMLAPKVSKVVFQTAKTAENLGVDGASEAPPSTLIEKRLPKDAFAVEAAINDICEEALEAAQNTSGVLWQEDGLSSLLRQLVSYRYDSSYDSKGLILREIPLPLSPAKRVLCQELIKRRILIPIQVEGQTLYRLVHEAVLHHWESASTWLKNEEKLLKAALEMRRLAPRWEAGKRDPERAVLQKSEVDYAAILLRSWNDVFAATQESIPLPEDARLRDFLLAVVERSDTPEAAIADKIKYENDKGIDENDVVPAASTHFLLAVSYAQTELVDRWLRRCPDCLKHISVHGNTPLFMAIGSGSEAMLRLILQHDPSSIQQRKEGWTPFFLSVFQKDETLALCLLHHGADPSITNAEGWTACHVAVQVNALAMLKLCIAHGIDPWMADVRGWNSLHLAARSGFPEVTAFLCKHFLQTIGATQSPGETNEGWSVLSLGVSRQSAAVLRELLQMPQLRPLDKANGFTAYEYAINDKYDISLEVLLQDTLKHLMTEPDHARFLLRQTITEPETNKGKLLARYYQHHATGAELLLELLTEKIETGTVKSVNALLSHEIIRKRVAQNPFDLLQKAARRSSIPMVSALLTIEPICHAMTLGVNGLNALHEAVLKGNGDAIKSLAEWQKEHNEWDKGRVPTRDGRRTALHLAAGTGQNYAATLLLDAGADAQVADSLGWMPLHYALQSSSLEVITRLLDVSAYAANNVLMCQTTLPHLYPLQIAAEAGNKEAVELLLDRGANPSQDTADRSNAFVLAAKNGQWEVLWLLIGRVKASDITESTLNQIAHHTRKRTRLREAAGNPCSIEEEKVSEWLQLRTAVSESQNPEGPAAHEKFSANIQTLISRVLRRL